MSLRLGLASVVIGVSFSGLLGGLVAIPVAGCIRVAVLEYPRQKDMIDDPEIKKKLAEALFQKQTTFSER